MSIWATLFGAGGDTLAKPIDAIGNVLDKVLTSKEEKLAGAAVLEKLKQRPAELQVEINKLEAQHKSRFVAGWRPAIGWVCAASLAFYFIPQYIVGAYLWAKISLATGAVAAFPISADGLFQLVLALLGMSTLRTYEKVTKVSK
jgi:hypothetical protein